MFLDPTELTGISELAKNWQLIRSELEAAQGELFKPWKERHIYEGAWDTVFLFDGYKSKTSRRIEINCAAFPHTSKLMAAVPGVLSGGFSRLGPRTRIVSHRGFDPEVARVHLGISVPEGCWLAVRWERKFWKEGEVFAFDDTCLHMADNPTDFDRVVLILDVDLGQKASASLARLVVPHTPADLLRYALMAADLARRHLGKVVAKYVKSMIGRL